MNKTEDEAAIAYNYNKDNNHLTSISTGESYNYNDRGDMMSSDGNTFDYDEEGRLISVDMGDSTLSFLYSAEGKRIRKIADKGTTADTTYYIYDGMNVVVELNGSLNKKKSYGYIGAMLVMVEDEADNKHYYSHDGLGSIIAIYDASGNYVNVYMYDEFGNFLQKSENISNSYYYTGQELDAISGLYNLRNRYYNASLGRFTQLDPIVDLLGIENMQELNGYAYVANNPMILVDPFGLCGEDGFDWMAFGHTIVTVGGGATLGFVGDFVFPGLGTKVTTVLSITSGSEIRGSALVSSFTLGKAVFLTYISIQSGGVAFWATAAPIGGALFVTGLEGSNVYYYYKEANNP